MKPLTFALFIRAVPGLLVLASCGPAESTRGATSSSSPAPASRSCTADQTRDEDSVWSAAIRHELGAARVVIENPVGLDRMLKRFGNGGPVDVRSLQKDLPDLLPATAASFLERNQSGTFTLADRLPGATKVVLVDPKELSELFQGSVLEGWERFQARFPDADAIVRLSRVGFSANCSQALVYIEKVCGPLCGSAHYLLLRRDGEQWTVSKRRMIWISHHARSPGATARAAADGRLQDNQSTPDEPV